MRRLENVDWDSIGLFGIEEMHNEKQTKLEKLRERMAQMEVVMRMQEGEKMADNDNE
jgi:hypothetical protein